MFSSTTQYYTVHPNKNKLTNKTMNPRDRKTLDLLRHVDLHTEKKKKTLTIHIPFAIAWFYSLPINFLWG